MQFSLFTRISKMLPPVVFILYVVVNTVQSAETKTQQDYHLSVYNDVQGSTDAIELFTKAADKRVFFGVTCSVQSPLPLVQVILFDDEVMSETPKLLTVNLSVDGKPIESELQGILKVIDNAEEFSNKVRIELVVKRGGSFQAFQDGYQALLARLQQGKVLSVQLSHRTLEVRDIEFSLNGLKPLLKPYQRVCH